MKYNDIRGNIRSGDILAWSHRELRTWKDLKIWFVRLFTRSEYSHIATAWVVGGRVFVLEAVQPLVRIYPLSKLGTFYWIPMNAQWKDSTEILALEHVGDKYSQIQAMQSPFKKIPRDRLWECAEYSAAVAESDDINLGEEYTPTAIVDNALARGTLHKVENDN